MQLFIIRKGRLLFTLVLFFAANCLCSQNRWSIQSISSSTTSASTTVSAAASIVWNPSTSSLPHADHIEMSGESVSAVLRYGISADSSFFLERSLVWPLLRTIPNNTHASLMHRFAIDYPSLITINSRSLQEETVEAITIDGRLCVKSICKAGKAIVELNREFFPSTKLPMLCEKYSIKNLSDKEITLIIPEHKAEYYTDAAKGVEGVYTLVASLLDNGLYKLAPGQEHFFGACVQAYSSSQTQCTPNIVIEEKLRLDFVKEVQSKLVFDSPDNVINTAFAFAKIRASESIYKTSGGYMHGPGGESYYAAIWANDQAEYINPFFPFLGYSIGNESALNAYRHFARFMNPDFKPIPSSIIAQGKDIWNGAGDRGDAAMIAYGAARYALERGIRSEAEELWPLITWCLEYCRQKLNADGVVLSDTDELEGRFPAGEANLCTSCLYYDALVSANYLARELGKPVAQYLSRAKALKKAINSYFGANVEGYETYRYYKENRVLRSWICIPLVMGIMERREGTIDALFSPRLWTENGLLTEAGSFTFWDRSTLYALRGVYAAGAREKATAYLKHYSTTRLLGNHVPYPIEAWPEGSQRHLSAESGLYCRIITEGLFGIRPTGFKTFNICPQLPEQWDYMTLNDIYAFGNNPFTIEVKRNAKDLAVKVINNEGNVRIYRCQNGETIEVKF